jgi:hypothetical protein
MKKGKARGTEGLRRGYQRSDFPAGLHRGKYASRLSKSTVRLKPEIAAAFPTDEAVNAALAAVLRKQRSGRGASRARTREK